MAGRSRTNSTTNELQSSYPIPYRTRRRQPSSGRCLDGPNQVRWPDTPVGADLSKPWPSPRQCGTPTTKLGIRRKISLFPEGGI